MKNSIDRSEDMKSASTQAQSANPERENDTSSPAPSLRLFDRYLAPRDNTIRIPPGGETILDIFRKSALSDILSGASRHFLDIMQDMSTRGVHPATESLTHLQNWWRENARAIAADATRTASDIKITAKDVLATLDHGSTGNPLKDAAIDAAMHSRFAQAAETYLIEATAPSPQMRGVFEQFRDWLTSIYRRLVALDFPLAPDVAAIFFRLLACDTAIDMAQADLGGEEPVFASAEAAGLAQPRYDRLLKLRALAAQEAKSRLLRQMMEPVRREDETAYKAEKAAVRREVEKEIDATGLYRAIEWMANGRWLDAQTPAPSGDIRFDRAALETRYGAGILDALPRGRQPLHADRGGLDPDIVADLFGLGSGDELVAAMTLAPARADAIAFEVERVMLERHSDMLIDGSAEERAIAALHNDRRAEWLAAELAALIEVAGSGDGLTAAEAKAYARSATAGMEVADAMDGARFLAAGRRTGIEAVRLGEELGEDAAWRERASRKPGTGDGEVSLRAGEDERIGKLITARRRQLLNHATYAESLEIAGEVEKIEAKAASLAGGPARESLAQAVLRDGGRIDYAGAVDALLDRYGLAGERKDAAQGRGDPRAALRDYMQAMKDEGRENELAIPDSVLIGSGRQSYKEITLERLRAVAAALGNIQHAARRAGKLVDADRKADLAETVSSLVRGLKSRKPATDEALRPFHRARAADAALTDMDAGFAWQAFKAPFAAAAERLAQRRQKAGADLQALYDVYSPQERRQMDEPRYLPALGQSLSKWEAIAIALNTGNEVNRRRLTDARIEGAFDEAGLDAVLGLLDARDAAFVQSVWDYLASFEPDIAAREKRLTGITPQWVAPTPVTIAGKALRGGYYPLAYDGVETAEELSQALLRGRCVKSATAAGHGRSRAGRPLAADIAVLHRHVNHFIHDLELCEPLANARRLLEHEELKDAMARAGRLFEGSILKGWMNDIGAGALTAAGLVGRSARLAKDNAVAASLAQELAATLCSRYPLTDMIAAAGRADFLAGLRSGFDPELPGRLADRSPEIGRRSILGDRGTAWETTALWLGETLQFFLVEMPLWLACHDKAERQPGADQARAIADADAGIRQATSGLRPRRAERSETLRLFKALTAHLAGKFEAAAGDGNADAARAARQGASLAMDLTALAMVDAVFAAAIGTGTGTGDGDGDAALLARQTAYSVMACLPAIRDAKSPPAGGGPAALARAVRPPRGDLGIGEEHIDAILAASGLTAQSPAGEIPRKVAAGLAQIAGA
ncbi:hypothetical protein ACFPWW_26985 [Rhizobium sp. GCM10022189]